MKKPTQSLLYFIKLCLKAKKNQIVVYRSIDKSFCVLKVGEDVYKLTTIRESNDEALFYNGFHTKAIFKDEAF